MLFYTGCVLAVLVLGGPTVESLTDEEKCELYAEKGNCTFYTDCLEAKYDCKSEGYPVGYAHKYCTKFQTHYSSFNDWGKEWINDTRKCLIEALLPAYKNPKYKCDELKEFAFDTHPRCYTDSGFCRIFWTNSGALVDVFDFGDFFGSDWNLALEQVLLTILRCPFVAAYDCYEIVHDFVEKIWTNLLPDDTPLDTLRISRSLPGLQTDCVAKAIQGDCDFFNCLEGRHPCGTKGFASQEGRLMCERLNEKKGLFKAEDQLWVTDYTKCLTRSLITKYSDSSTSCRDISVFGYRTLYSCLIDTGICDLVRDSQNEFALWHIVDVVLGNPLFKLELSTILCRCEKYEGGSRYKRKYSNALGGYIKQKAPVVDQSSSRDAPCDSQGGKCQDYTVRMCLAGYETNQCGGNSFRRCCLPCDSSCRADHETWSTGDNDCSNAGGQCRMDSNFCYGQYRTGLCGGPAGRKCCVPGSSETGSASCTVHRYTNTSFVGSSIYVDDGFRDSMDKINTVASECIVTVHITSSWRKVDQDTDGAIVTPARRSNHFVGHAIDMNVIRPDGTLCNSECLGENRDPHATCFIGKVQAAGLTWGGVWSTPDPVHIDDRLNLNTAVYDPMVDRLQQACRHI